MYRYPIECPPRMSGETALSVRSGYVRLQGCSELQSRVCHHLVCTLVRCGAGVLSGVKPAALFSVNLQACARACEDCSGSCSCGQITDLATEAILALARGLSKRGIGLVTVWRSSNRLMLHLCRECSIGSLLENPSIRTFLLRSGLEVSCPRAVVGEFAQRLGLFYAARQLRDGRPPRDGQQPRNGRQPRYGQLQCDARLPRDGTLPWFPHEIGLILGFPLQDVIGFMNGDVPTWRGPWLAYGNAQCARERYARALVGERSCRYGFQQGMSLGVLAACPTQFCF